MKNFIRSIILVLAIIVLSFGKAYASEKMYLLEYINNETILLLFGVMFLINFLMLYLYMNQKIDTLQSKLKKTENFLIISERFNTSLRENNRNLSEQIMWHEKQFRDISTIYPDINDQIASLRKNELK